MNDLIDVSKADGLTDGEREMLRDLVTVYQNKLTNNQKQMRYYKDKNELKNLGLSVPRSFEGRINTCVGWAAKAVDMLAERSRFDGFTAAGDAADELNAVMADNDMANSYAMAVPTQLVHSVGFWTVSAGKDDDPKVVVNYHDAESAAALWDYRRKRIKCGMVVEDVVLNVMTGELDASYVVLHTDEAVVEIAKTQTGWKAERKPNWQGRPLMVPMAFKSSHVRPFGKSRITPAMMGIIDEAQREILRTSLHSEMYSTAPKAIVGLSEEQFDAINENKWQVAMTQLFTATADENGNVPQLTQFQQQSMEPHIAAQNKLAERMASESSLPVAAFGIQGNGYTSSEALRASNDDLIVIAESLNAANGKALKEVALLVMAALGNTTVEKLTEEQKAVSVHWADPAAPSVAAMSDAMTKQAAIVDWLPETSVFWEKLGYSEDERRRIMSEKESAQSAAAFAALLGGESVTVENGDD